MRNPSTTMALALVAALLLFVPPAGAQPAGYETYYVLGNEFQVWQMWAAIKAGEGSVAYPSTLVRSVISFTITQDDQKIVYDHWEDGYEVDPLNPVTGGTTQIFGDNDAGNGLAPGYAVDEFTAGNFVKLESGGLGTGVNAPVPTDPRGTALRWDGGDRIYSVGGPINVQRALWPNDAGGQTIGDAWELYAVRTLESNLQYRVPVGVNNYVVGQDAFSEFKYVYLQVGAPEDNTTVVVDNGLRLVTVNLQQGQTYSSQGYVDSTPRPDLQIDILQGTKISGSSAIQAGIITAEPGTFGARFFQLLAEKLYGTDYVCPVPTFNQADGRTELYVFNPGAAPVSVRAWDVLTGAGGYTFTVPAGGAVAYSQVRGTVTDLPNSSIRLQASGLIWGIGSGSSGSTAYDWGFALIPSVLYDPEGNVAWAPGTIDLTSNWNPLYVAPTVDNTTFTVDWNADGVLDPIDTSGDGRAEAGPYVANALGYFRMYKPRLDVGGNAITFPPSSANDQSGALIAADGPFVGAWGCDPSQGNSGPNLDWGYTLLPWNASYLDQVLALTKTAAPPSVDVTGGQVTYTLTASAPNYGPVTDVDFIDVLPAGATYVTSSAWLTYPSGDRYQVEPTTIAGNTLTWDLSNTLQATQQLMVTFAANLAFPAALVVAETFETGTLSGGTNWTAASWTELNEADGPAAGLVRVTSDVAAHGGTYHLRLEGAAGLLDTFESNTYTGGSGGWTSNWTEVGENDGAAAGRVLLANDVAAHSPTRHLRLDGKLISEPFTAVNYTGGTNWTDASWTEVGESDGAAAGLVQVAGDVPSHGGSYHLRLDGSVMATEDFESNTYAGGTGWASNWAEVGESDGPAAGRVQLTADVAAHSPTRQLRLEGGVIVASDGFESGFPGSGSGWTANWTTVGTVTSDNNRAYTGARSMRFTARNSTATRPAVVGALPYLSFWVYRRNNDSGRRFAVSVSGDGATFTELQAWTNNDRNWRYFEYDVSSYVGAGGALYVRFSTGNDTDAPDVSIDDVRLTNMFGASRSVALGPEPTLNFWRRLALGANASASLQASTNGTTWTPLRTWTNVTDGAWVEESVDLAAYANQTVYLRFHSTNPAGAYVRFDDLVILRRAGLSRRATLGALPTLSLWRQLSLGAGQSVALQVSVDGTTWTVLRTWTNVTDGAWVQETVDLAAYAGQTVWLRFYGASAAGSYARFDDLELLQSYGLYRRATLGAQPALSFWRQLNLAADRSARVQISTNGATWTDLVTWTATSNGSTWVEEYVDLAAYAGLGIYLRFYGPNVDGSYCRFDDVKLPLRRAGVTRNASLATLAQPTLSLWRQLALGTGHTASVQVSADGATWTTLRTYLPADNGVTWLQDSFDVSAYANSSIYVRVSASNDAGAYTRFDDVQISSPNAVRTSTNTGYVTGRRNGDFFKARARVKVSASALRLDKTVDKAQAAVGEELTYSLTVTSLSGSSLSNVTVEDGVPPNTTYVAGSASSGGTYAEAAGKVSWSLGTLAAGASATVSFKARVSQALADTVITNIGRVWQTPSLFVESPTVTTRVVVPDLRVEKAGTTNVSPGGTVSYSLRFANLGSATATNLVITDAIPSGTGYRVAGSTPGVECSSTLPPVWTPMTPAGTVDWSVKGVRWLVPSLAATGSTSSVSFSVVASSAVPVWAQILNKFTVTCDQTPERASNVLVTYVSQQRIRKSADVALAEPWQPITYTLTFWNEGSSAVSALVTDAIPYGSAYAHGTVTAVAGGPVTVMFSNDLGRTWSSSDGMTGTTPSPTDVTHLQFSKDPLPASAATTTVVRFTVMTDLDLPALTTISNQATLRTSTTTGTVFSDLVEVPTVRYQVLKSADRPIVSSALPVTFTLTYSTNGSAPATATVLTDHLPPGLTVVPGSFSLEPQDPDARPLVWDLGTLPPVSGLRTITFQATPTGSPEPGTNFTNEVRLGNAVSNPNHNYARATVSVGTSGVTILADEKCWPGADRFAVFAHRVINTSSQAATVQVSVAQLTWPGAVASVWRDVDGDGGFDPDLDVLLGTSDAAWLSVPRLLLPGEEERLLVTFTVPAGATTNGLTLVSARLAGDADPTRWDDATDTTYYGPTAVRLSSFTATGRPDGAVRVAWRTAAELGSLLFRVLRSEDPWDAPRPLGLTAVARGSSVRGASYEVVDPTAARGRLYWYWLEEEDRFGVRNQYGPAPVDWDGDGLPDEWELRMGLDPTRDDAAEDPDGDGLTNLEEYLRGREPLLADEGGRGAPPQGEVLARGGGAGWGVRVVTRTDDAQVLELLTPDVRCTPGQAGTRVTIPSYVHGYTTEVGSPLVPVEGYLLDLAPDRMATSLDVLEVEEEARPPVDLAPVPRVVPLPDARPPRLLEVAERSGPVWATAAPWPTEAAWLDGQQGLVRFAPVAWEPSQGTLELRRRILVRVGLGPRTASARAASAAAPLTADWAGYPTPDRAFFRVRVTGDGLHRLSFEQLRSAGWPAAPVPTSTLALFGPAGEVGLEVRDGDGDGLFGPADSLVFEAAPSPGKYDAATCLFLTPDAGRPGLRLGAFANPPAGSAPLVTTHRHTVHLERQSYYWPGADGADDEDRFFDAWIYNFLADGIEYAAAYETSVHLDRPVVDAGEQAVVRARLNADLSAEAVDPDHLVRVTWRGLPLPEVGHEGTGYFVAETALSQDRLAPGSNDVAVGLGRQPGMPYDGDRADVDWLEVTYTRHLAPAAGALTFEAPAEACTVELTGVTAPAVTVVERAGAGGVARRLTDVEVSGPGPYVVRFGLDAAPGPRRLAVAEEQLGFLAPASVEPAPAPSLRTDLAGADLMVVAPAAFAQALSPLLDLRRTQGLIVRTATPEEVYDQFAGGRRTPWAFRDLLAFARSGWGVPPRYLLLVGDASWDPLNAGGLDATTQGLLVPTPLSMTYFSSSTGRLETPCDALLGRLPDAGGLPTVAVGRLPASNAAELQLMVARILAYEAAPAGQPFQRQGLFVAGAGAEGPSETEQYQEALEGGIRFLPDGFLATRLVEPDYPSTLDARAAFLAALAGGALIVDYEGHGAWDMWSGVYPSPPLLDRSTVAALASPPAALPVVVGMTCLDGSYARVLDGALEDSLAEAWLKAPGGAVAAFCAAGMATVGAKQALHDGLFDSLFRAGRRRLGDAVLEAQRACVANGPDLEDVAKVHALLGDPCLRVRLPFPDAPAAVALLGLGDGHVRVSWSAVPDADLTGYRIERSTSAGGPYLDLGPVPAGSTTFDDPTPGWGTYYYVVYAENAGGFRSPASGEVAITTAGSTPGGGGGGGGCSVGRAAPGGVALSWLAPLLLAPATVLLRRRRSRAR